MAAWTQARKFCVAESGSRTPEPFDAWGLWAHALRVRLGHDLGELGDFEPRTLTQAGQFRPVLHQRVFRCGLDDLGRQVPVSYTHLRAHETVLDLVCRLLLEKKKHTLMK